MTPTMPRWLWRICLCWLFIRHDWYANWWNVWPCSGEECWLIYWEDGYTPSEAIYEDMTHD
jgi:hypothetical protein